MNVKLLIWWIFIIMTSKILSLDLTKIRIFGKSENVPNFGIWEMGSLLW